MKILNHLTNRYLKLNKKRTIVTIIGIILSGAMISAVTTLAASFQQFMISVEEDTGGKWEGSFQEISYANAQQLEERNEFKETFMTAEYGLAENPYREEEFIRIRQYDEKSLENFSVKLVEGEYPKNENEILMSETYIGKELKPGDTITLNFGQRMHEGEPLNIKNQYLQGETFLTEETKTFTISGIMKRQSFEGYDVPYTGAIVLTDVATLQPDTKVNFSVIMKKPKQIYDTMEEMAKEYQLYETEEIMDENLDFNDSLLIYKGVNGADSFTITVFVIAGILIFVIAVGSIMVIYNSFAISVSERKKQFGMLSSVGATKKQIKKSVLYEGAVLGLIGIPIGILSGIGGIYVTLGIVNELLQPLFAEQGRWNLTLTISYPAILIAIVLIALTIYFSVIIPARRASKITPIEAIRQTDDIKVKPKKLKTPKFLRKIYGIEGDIALKNLKRSKKRYRTTVASLAISIILFITFSSFIDYMFMGFDNMYLTVDYDYAIWTNINENTYAQTDNMMNDILTIPEIEKGVYIKEWTAMTELSDEQMNSQVKKQIEKNEDIKHIYAKNQNEKYEIDVSVVTLDEKTMTDYMKKTGVDQLGENEVIVVNHINALSTYQAEYNLTSLKKGEKIAISPISGEEEKIEKNVTVAGITKELPYGIMNSMGTLYLVTTQENLESIAQIEENAYMGAHGYIETDEPEKIEEQISKIEENYPDISIAVQHIGEEVLVMKNLKTIISIFLYGFIVLISAIGVANVFNTISTNIMLRRREFANLKSIGMTDKQFKKMLDLECIFYGTKALIFSLPIGIILSLFINKGFQGTVSFAYILPWKAILISIIAVYVIVYITMKYARKKVEKENIVDVLRTENI